MYFTVIRYQPSDKEFKIIHTELPQKLGNDAFKFMDYVSVNSKPTIDEAKIILELCITNHLVVGVKNATTVEL